MLDRMWIRHKRQQGRFSRFGCVFLVHSLVGKEKLAVSFFIRFCSEGGLDYFGSSWLLILGMAGLIILFWFVGGGIALRFFVLFIGVMSCMYVVWDVIGKNRIISSRNALLDR
jgi:hypothetical protein